MPLSLQVTFSKTITLCDKFLIKGFFFWYTFSRGGKALIAQLMRLHVVTPKAAVHVTLDPKVRPAPPPCPEFFTGFPEPVQLSPSSYWILRFPYVYEDENQIYTPPKESSRAAQHGYLLKGTCGVVEIASD